MFSKFSNTQKVKFPFLMKVKITMKQDMVCVCAVSYTHLDVYKRQMCIQYSHKIFHLRNLVVVNTPGLIRSKFKKIILEKLGIFNYYITRRIKVSLRVKINMTLIKMSVIKTV